MRNILGILLLAWAIAFVGSFIAFWLTPANDFGFTAGMNKVTTFFGWQAVATLLAIACLAVRWTASDKRMRWLAAIPAIAVALMLSALAVLFFWASLQRTPPDAAPTPKPVTEPAPVTSG